MFDISTLAWFLSILRVHPEWFETPKPKSDKGKNKVDYSTKEYNRIFRRRRTRLRRASSIHDAAHSFLGEPQSPKLLFSAVTVAGTLNQQNG
jgi:hypothetical protein